MVKLSELQLSSKFPFSQLCVEKQLMTFEAVCTYVKHLPYGRNSDRSDFSLVIKEQKGTCSTKHAFLSQIAIENSFETIDLYIGIYAMTEQNTKGVGLILKQFDVDFIPEAHTYLKIDGDTFDFTTSNSHHLKFKDCLMFEEKILPYQIGAYKLNLHQTFIKNWIAKSKYDYSFEDIWTIREACISELSQ